MTAKSIEFCSAVFSLDSGVEEHGYALFYDHTAYGWEYVDRTRVSKCPKTGIWHFVSYDTVYMRHRNEQKIMVAINAIYDMPLKGARTKKIETYIELFNYPKEQHPAICMLRLLEQ